MDTFVAADWVAAHAEAEDLRVVDVRDGWEYDGIGHLPGAVNVPFETFRAGGDGTDGGGEATATDSVDGGAGGGGDSDGGDPGMLPGESTWTDLLGEAGVAGGDRIVAYDDTHGVFAARFVVTALLYGHPLDRLAVLDGDYSAWSRDHGTTTAAVDPEPTDYAVDRPTQSPLVGFEAVREAVDDPETVVLDTRERWEYEEGHLPGAAQLDWMALVDEADRGLRPEDEVKATLADRGVDRDTPVVLYCNTARRISHTYLALRQLGFDDVAFYEGSLTEWEARGGPVEAGAD
ncbi:MAG: sulfurtransferase [Halolamina sp.]